MRSPNRVALAPTWETLTAAFRRRGLSRRTCMTAVRRLLIIVCALAATMASAQTTRRPRTNRPAPAPAPANPEPTPTTLTTSPAQSDMPARDQAATAPVTADTDKDVSNPRALHLTLDEAIKTTMERNIGIQL